MDAPIVNRVANSGIITLNLENYFPDNDFVVLDIKDYLFKELILKEKDFRTALKEYDWSSIKDKILLVYCSSDAIIPVWAFMLVGAYAAPFAAEVYQGTETEYLKTHYNKIIQELDVESYKDQRIVIKGCSNKPVPPSAYSDLTYKLQPTVRSIMYGEPCSTVPIYKRKPKKA